MGEFKSFWVFAVISLIVLAGAACQPAAQPEPVAEDTTEADVAGLRALVSQYDDYSSSGNINGGVALFTADAISMAPDAAPAVGSDAIRAQWEPDEAEGGAFELSSTVEDVRVAGDLGVLRIHYTVTTTAEGGEAATEQGKWILVCERQADGSWRITDEMWTTYEE